MNGSRNSLFPLNWQYLNTASSDPKYLFADFAKQLKHESDQNGYGSLLKLAFEQVIDSHDVL